MKTARGLFGLLAVLVILGSALASCRGASTLSGGQAAARSVAVRMGG